MADDQTPNTFTHFVELVRETIPPLHPGGRPVVLGVAAATVLTRLLLRKVGLNRLSRLFTRVGTAATIGSAAFFRSPVRVSPLDPDLVLAPADGLVSLIESAAPPAELNLGTEPRLRVSIVLSVLDVHVQRIPIGGVITQVAYHPGKFLSADLDKASEDNERNSLVIRPTGVPGGDIVVTQIAGMLARRIVCDVVAGNAVNAGHTYGLIRFGSRVDTYFPVGTELRVRVGQRTIGGETVLADISTATRGAAL